MASVASGAVSYPVAKLLIGKLVSRRNSLVTQFGLISKYGLLKADVAQKGNISGAGSFVLRDHKGKATQTITIPQGGFVVREGVVVEAGSK